ncbi:MAG: TonB-dependent receptor [Gammaproteobacteria bacterium]|nr:TonB-dependent receptor [Gammaproteobacteria bacterium]
MKLIPRLNLSVAIAAALGASLSGTAAAQSEDAVEEVVVTGSRLTRSNISSPVPLLQIGFEEIQNRGITRIEEVVNLLPNVFASQTSQVANGASGTSSLNLRGLESQRTLVLMDGKRLPFGSPFTSPPNVDLIPSALVERVDVLTSGASAVYGSDAVAGVVNFITRRDFEGFELNVQSGWRQNPNDNGFMADVLSRNGIADPDGVTAGEDYQVTATMGLNSSDGRGNITAFASYQRQKELLGADRDTGACTLGGTAVINCVGSSNFRRFNAAPGIGVPTLFQEADGTLIPLTGGPQQTYNFGARNHYQRPIERWNLNASGHYEVTDNLEAYIDIGFLNNNTTAQIAESASFNRPFMTNCDNPLLQLGRGPSGTGLYSFGDFIGTGRGASFVSCNTILADGDTSNDGVEVNFINSHRNVEGGPRISTYENNTFRFIGGMRGDVAEDFSYDIFGQYARTRGQRVSQRDLNFNRVQQALYIVADDNGNPVCRDSTGGCVPWNIFDRTASGDTLVTDQAVNFIQGVGIVSGETEQIVLGGTLEGDFSSRGIKLPSASDGLTGLVGFEYREDHLSRLADDISQIPGGRGLTGTGGGTLPISGDIDVFELFLEAELPLIQNAPLAEELGVNAGYRYSDYTTAGLDPQTRQDTENSFTADTWFVGASWTPISDIRFRANFSRSIRAPNVFDLFVGANTGLTDLSTGENGLFDPCASGFDAEGNVNVRPQASQEACARTGATAAQYNAGIEDNPAGQYNLITGGNAGLLAETSDTTTFGVVITPSAIEGLSVAIDIFDIEVSDAIDSVPAQASLDGCIAGGPGSETFCSLLQRDTFGTLWLSNDAPGGGLAGISQQNANIALFRTEGIDVNATYALELNNLGSVNFDYAATFLDSLEKTPFAGADPIECVNVYAGQCELPSPDYRHRFLATWITPLDFSVALTWRHVGETTLFGLDTQAAAQREEWMNDYMESRDYLDLAVNYDFSEGINLRVGVNNLLAEDPPTSTNVGTGTGNNNTYPGLFDTSRYLFAAATMRF